MKPSDIRQLKERWDDQYLLIGAAVLAEGGKVPFSIMSDGYVDLRGIKISQIINNAVIKDVDLSGGYLEGFGQFSKCKVENSRFCYTKLPTNIGDSFRLCDFSSAKLNGALLRGVFESCDFTLSNLSSVRGNQVRFVECVFVKTNFNKAMFTHCVFEDCKFEGCNFINGSLAYSKFIRSPIDSACLGNTIMDRVVFSE